MTVQQAPDFTLEHIKGERVTFSSFRGQRVVLVFAGKDSGDQARQIVISLRNHFSPDELPALSVLDMHNVPRLVQGIARGQILKGYADAAREIQADAESRGWSLPADLTQVVVMLMDWDGKVAASYGLTGVDRQAVALLIDEQGQILGQASGATAGDTLLPLIQGR